MILYANTLFTTISAFYGLFLQQKPYLFDELLEYKSFLEIFPLKLLFVRNYPCFDYFIWI